MQFKVTKHYKESIKHQLQIFESEGVITNEQRSTMENAYVEVEGISLTRLVSVVGSVLVGLGILTYIAGNWQYLSPLYRVGLILFGITGTYAAGMYLDGSYPRTAKAMRYISLFIFGGGLFLTDQTFNLNRPVAFHFLIWSVGVLAVLWMNRDYLLMVFFEGLIIASTLSLFDVYGMADATYWMYMGVTAAGVFLSVRLAESSFRNVLIALLSGFAITMAILSMLIRLDVQFVVGSGVLFALGILFMTKPPIGKFAEQAMNQFGLLVLGISGFTLTFADPWKDVLHAGGDTAAIVFTIALLAGMFYLVRKEYAGAIAFIAAIILRYYFDTFYDFMPKSMFFVIGGGILIGFGVYLESVRRKGLKKHA